MIRGARKFLNYIFSVTRIFLILLLALFLPRIFLIDTDTKTYASTTNKKIQFKLGLENITDKFLRTLSKNGTLDFTVGLITNQTGKDQTGKRNVDVLQEKGLHIKKIFVPEHGLDGNVKAGKSVANSIDKKTTIPIISLYAKGITQKYSEKMLREIDVLIFDMQEAGMRHFTYITTLFEAIDSAAQFGKVLVVLDRPNLLGAPLEGPLVEKHLKSTISFAPIPLRYGMTTGELALYYNKNIAPKKANIHIVQMKNYRRDSLFPNKLLSHLSPNIQNPQSCYGYSFLGLLGEIRPLCVGVGTKKSFQLILLPEDIKFSKEKWQRLHMILKLQRIDSIFHKYFDTQKKKHFHGLKINIKNINNVSSFNALMEIVKFFKKEGVDLQFSAAFNKAVGTDEVRNYLDNKISGKQLAKHINKNLDNFYKKAASYFMYQPFPRIEYAYLF